MLVLSPTRELSGQILDSFRTYGRHLRIQSALAIGGVPMDAQVRALLQRRRRAGRHAGPSARPDPAATRVRLSEVEMFVLDEADRMLDMGFIRDIRKIVAKLPKERQTLLFSATMPQDIAELARQMLQDPAKVVGDAAGHHGRAHRAARSSTSIAAASPRCCPTCSSRRRSIAPWCSPAPSTAPTRWSAACNKAGIAAEAIHGNKSQNQRERVLKDFRDGRVRTLVATDIAARGIDVDGISHVINFDLPNIPESYVHRIGRTARAGADGIAISLLRHDELPFLRDIEKLIRMAIPATGQSSQPRPGQRPPQRSITAAPANSSGTPKPRSGQPQRRRPQWRPQRTRRATQRPEARPRAQ